MRKILFRAFVKDKGKVYNIKQIDFDYGMVWFEEENKPTDTMRMFDQIELMQFTGLTDKNGNKIFEGDIVLLKARGNVKNADIKVIVEDISISDSTKKYLQNGFIIGNIHDNPELLGEQQ